MSDSDINKTLSAFDKHDFKGNQYRHICLQWHPWESVKSVTVTNWNYYKINQLRTRERVTLWPDGWILCHCNRCHSKRVHMSVRLCRVEQGHRCTRSRKGSWIAHRVMKHCIEASTMNLNTQHGIELPRSALNYLSVQFKLLLISPSATQCCARCWAELHFSVWTSSIAAHWRRPNTILDW